MMKPKTINPIGCLLCIAILLVGVGGCGKQHTWGLVEYMTLEVDDVEYRIIWAAKVDQRGRYIFSTLIVSPLAESAWVGIDSALVPQNVQSVSLQVDDMPNYAKTNTLYFMRSDWPARQGGRIVLEKEYQEVGIDASRMSADFRATLDYLRPILETLIRENMPLQGGEMEWRRKMEEEL